MVTAEPNTRRLNSDSVRKKIIALFICGLKLSTLNSQGQFGLINPLDSCPQSALQPKTGHIKYVPLLLHKCKWAGRQNPGDKLIVIKTPTAQTDTEIKGQRRMQRATRLHKIQHNYSSRSQSHAPTAGYLNTLIWICISFTADGIDVRNICTALRPFGVERAQMEK